MNKTFHAWISQVTTGHGIMILGPTLLAVLSGEMSFTNAIPLLVAGVVGLLWPENTAAKAAAQTTATDVEALIAAYRTGLDHAATPAATTGNSVPAVPPRSAVAASLAGIALGGLMLTACSEQTQQQRVAGMQAVASGLVCVADAAGKVIATASTDDPNGLKAANAAMAAGGTLLTNAACQTAIANGAVALTRAATPAPAAASSAPSAAARPVAE